MARPIEPGSQSHPAEDNRHNDQEAHGLLIDRPMAISADQVVENMQGIQTGDQPEQLKQTAVRHSSQPVGYIRPSSSSIASAQVEIFGSILTGTPRFLAISSSRP